MVSIKELLLDFADPTALAAGDEYQGRARG